MTTETRIGLTELLAKARETREAKRQQYEAVEAAAQAEKRQRIDEAVAEARAIVEPALEGIAARAAAFDAYIAILGAWRVEYERILTDNREMVQIINDRYDYRFDRHEVAYAAVGDEDDEPYRETAWAADGPDEDGWWRLYEDGRVVRRRLLRPLWVGDVVREKLSKAGAGGWRRAIFAHDAGESIYCLPWDEGEARQAMKSLVYPLPAEPSLPEELRDGLLTAERERINEVTRGMARVEIPF